MLYMYELDIVHSLCNCLFVHKPFFHLTTQLFFICSYMFQLRIVVGNKACTCLYMYLLCPSNAVLLTETKYVAHNFLHQFERERNLWLNQWCEVYNTDIHIWFRKKCFSWNVMMLCLPCAVHMYSVHLIK
jgi:hypothetical protein